MASKADLARQLGVTAGAVSHWFTGRNSPRFEVLFRYLASLPTLEERWAVMEVLYAARMAHHREKAQAGCEETWSQAGE